MVRNYTKWTIEKVTIAKNLANKGSSSKEISEATGVSKRSAQTFIDEYLTTGQFILKNRKNDDKNKEFRQHIQTLITGNCTLSLKQIQESLGPQFHNTSISTISREIKKLGWSKKRVK